MSPVNDLSGSKLNTLLAQLAGDDPVEREAARLALAELESPAAVRALVGELVDPRVHVRWEAAKTLGQMADPVAAPALVAALDDEEDDVRWVAAEGLIAMGLPGLLATLSGLSRHGRSIQYCRAAHHVVRGFLQAENKHLLQPVLAALDDLEPALSAPTLAFTALRALKPA